MCLIQAYIIDEHILDLHQVNVLLTNKNKWDFKKKANKQKEAFYSGTWLRFTSFLAFHAITTILW